MSAAQDGDLTARAATTTAYRVRLLRLAAGHGEEPSVEAEAGAWLEAEREAKIDAIHGMIQSYLEALNRSQSA